MTDHSNDSPQRPLFHGSAEQAVDDLATGFLCSIRGRHASHAMVFDGADLATLLLNGISVTLTKSAQPNTVVAIRELSMPHAYEAVADLLCNTHATEYLSKAIRADYDNVFLRQQMANDDSPGVHSTVIDFPRMGSHFSQGASALLPLFSTLFFYRGRLTSSFEVFVDPNLEQLRLELHHAFIGHGLQQLVDSLSTALDVRREAKHPEVAKGKQLAVPLSPHCIRDDHYLVVSPVPSVRMLYALNNAIERLWGEDRRGCQGLRLGGTKPQNIGSVATNLSSSMPIEGRVNVRALYAHVPPLRARLFRSQERNALHALTYKSALAVDDLAALAVFRDALPNPASFRRWVAMLPAVLLGVMEPLVVLRSERGAELMDLDFRHLIEKQFVCKTLPEMLLGRATSTESYVALGEHVASMIESRLLCYREFSSGLGIRRKMAIARSATRLARAML